MTDLKPVEMLANGMTMTEYLIERGFAYDAQIKALEARAEAAEARVKALEEENERLRVWGEDRP